MYFQFQQTFILSTIIIKYYNELIHIWNESICNYFKLLG